MKAHFYTLLQLFALLLYLAVHPTTFAQPTVEVGGILQKDTYWSSDTIYIITDLLRVNTGLSLTIEAGTHIKVNQAGGISIEGGSLIARGSKNDSIRFVPNYQENDDWYWQGIKVVSATTLEQFQIAFATIQRATIGIEAVSSDYILVENSLIAKNRNIGIRLFNSSFASILNNEIIANFLGIEVYATDPGNQSANNLFKGNNLKNTTTNIIVFNYNHGSCPNNIIEENLIQEGLHGIWLFNSVEGGTGHAHISRNIIIRNGTDNQGYGIHVAMDSTIISQNIFWNNYIPAYFTNAHYCHFINNQVYANQKGISVRNNSADIIALNNTFSGNKEHIVRFRAHEGVRFNENNIFYNELKQDIAINSTAFPIDMSENFWGTSDATTIAHLVYDRYDDPTLGEIQVWPLLENALTANPIAPPAYVEAQLIDGYMHLQWRKAKESDFDAFKIYQGNFQNYAFMDGITQITADTFFVFQEQSGWQQLAVTAIDKEANGNSPMLDGNESAFAFPVLMPWAGYDIIACQTNDFIGLEHATAPPEIDSLYWITSGDGNFNDALQLNPRYYPGEQDLQSGRLELILHIVAGGKLLKDTLSVTIHPLPLINAGQDAIIRKGDVFLTDKATATNFEGVWWSTPGDGIFSRPDSLQTIYIPGINDLDQEKVLLILQVFTAACGTFSDTLTLSIRNMYTLEGTVSAGGTYLPEQPVLAYYLNGGVSAQKVFLTHSSSSGGFRFDKLFEGEYYIFSPADTISSNIASYYAKAVHWQDAYKLLLNANTFDIDIKLEAAKINLPIGNGQISGFFENPGSTLAIAESYCQPWFNEAIFDCTVGLPNVSVMLYSAHGKKLLQHTLTSIEGNFSFTNLPYGDYHVKAEIAGYEGGFSEVLSLSSETKYLNNIHLSIIEENKIKVFSSEIEDVPSNEMVYPNPFTDVLHIKLKNMDNEHVIEIFSIEGRKLKTFFINSEVENVRLHLMDLPAGTYILRLKNIQSSLQTIILKQ